MINARTRNIGLSLSLAALLVACRQPQAAKPSGEEVFGAAPVRVVKVEFRRLAQTVRATGTIEAVQKITLTPDQGGKIARINVEEGDRVVKGQVLAEIDTESIRLQLKQAEAGRAVAEAAYNDARRNKERMDRLLKENAVSEQQYEQVRLGLESAQAQLEQARAAVNLARHTLDVSIMKAPFGGIVAAKNAEVGDVVNPMMGSFGAASGVLTLVDFSKVKVKIEVAQDAALRIRKGQPAELRVSSYPGRVFSGTVTVANLAADPLSKLFGVEVTVDNPDLALRPGTFGEVSVEIASREAALVVPQTAIVDQSFLFVAQDGKAVKRAVQVGLQTADAVEILSGLAEGEAVIVEGNYSLDDGAAIHVNGEVRK
ncbi:MAG: efflux RND transporter periplasmic adaptor subunit [Candidatus Aminicenantes bacterium]|nr:efflux RND transporter periplasmic adaptor subunit [Candidatus Aminicenantes bacterium]